MAIQTCSFLSFDAIKTDLEAYIQGLDDYQTWASFFSSGAGQTMIELMASTGQMYNYRIDTVRREAYLSKAQLKTSVYLIAQAMGYNPLRKTAPHFTMRADVSQDLSVQRTAIAKLGAHFVSVPTDTTIKKAVSGTVTVGVTTTYNKAAGGNKAYLEDTTLSPFGNLSPEQEFTTAGSSTAANNGTYTVDNVVSASKVEIVEDFNTNENFLVGTTMAALGRQIPVVLGAWTTYTKTVSVSTDFSYFLLGSSDFQVSTDIDGNGDLKYVEVSVGPSNSLVSKTPRHDRENFFTDDDVLVLTRHDGDVEVRFGDGIQGHKPSVNDEIQVFVLETPGQVLDVVDLSGSSFTSQSDFITNIQSVVAADVSTTGTNEESVKSVRNIAPRFYAALGRGVTLVDAKALTERFTHFQSTQVRETPGAVCEMDVAYLMDPEDGGGNVHTLTSQEDTDFRNFYETKHKIAGTKINLIAPTRKQVDFSIIVVRETSTTKASVDAVINTLIDDATLQLGESFYVGSLLKDINEITGVVRAYMVYPYEDKALGFGEYFKKRTVLITHETDQTALKEFSGDNDPGNDGYV